MKIIVFILTSLLFFSCGESNQTIEDIVVSKIDSIKETIIVDNYQDNILNFITNNTVNYDTNKFYSKTSAEAVILNDTEYLWTKNITFKQKKPHLNKKGDEFYRRFELKAFEYGDSIICNKSFDSWLMNFGTMAVPIKKGVFIRGFHVAPTFVIKTKVHITILFMGCGYISDEWNRLRLELLSVFDNEEEVEILSVGCGGPIEWKDRNSFEFELNTLSET